MTEQTSENSIKVSHNSKNIKSISFYSFNYQDALSHLRLIGPAHHLGLNVINGVENGQIFVERAVLGDIIVLQRDFPREIEAYDKILALARQNHIPVVLDIDDLLLELPEDHPDRISHAFTPSLLPLFLAMLDVDLITVTTSPLRDYASDYNKNVIILPNYLDDQFWQLKAPTLRTTREEKIVIGYMGGHTHQPDLAMLQPVIQALNNRFPERLEFRFWGTEPPLELSMYTNIHWDGQITWNYPDFASHFLTHSADILIAPLASNKFNRCKSSIKYLEYAALGVPGIYSNVNPYTDVIRHQHNGLLASSADEWIECLVQLIENTGLSYSIAINAQADITSNWLLSKNASLWLSAYNKALSCSKSREQAYPKYQNIIKDIAHQNAAWQRYETQQADLHEKKIMEQAATILGITNSRTWKLALLFRKIKELIIPPR
jgi:processive 1,2-diacylglycerol beta-glucosyltransferase